MYHFEDILFTLLPAVIGLIGPLLISAIKQFIETFLQSKKIEVAEKGFAEEREKKESIVKYIDKVLNLVIERDKLTMIKARGRSNYLFFIGTFLMILSVFAPILTIGIYITTEPLSVDMLNLLKEIKSQLGVTPQIKDIISQKDWRILLSGISFGFLFLASARSLLRQESRQIATYINLNRRISLFENTASALKIAEKIALDGEGEGLSIESLPAELHINHLIVRIVNLLLPTAKDVYEITRGDDQNDKLEDDISSGFMDQLKSIIEGGKK